MGAFSLDSFLQCAFSVGLFTLVEAANPRLQFYPCFQNSSPMSILLPSLCNGAEPPTTPGRRFYCGMNSALDFWQSSILVSSPGIGVVFVCFYHLLTELPLCPLSFSSAWTLSGFPSSSFFHQDAEYAFCFSDWCNREPYPSSQWEGALTINLFKLHVMTSSQKMTQNVP